MQGPGSSPVTAIKTKQSKEKIGIGEVVWIQKALAVELEDQSPDVQHPDEAWVVVPHLQLGRVRQTGGGDLNLGPQIWSSKNFYQLSHLPSLS